MDMRDQIDVAEKMIASRDYYNAFGLLEHMLKTHGDDIKVRKLHAVASVFTGKLPLAMEDYFHILSITEDEEARVELGGLYLLLEDVTHAKEQFTKVLEVNPLNKLALKGLADVYYAEQNYADALEIYDKMLEDNPQDGFIWYAKAETFLRAQDHEKALDAIEQALSIELRPEYFAFKGDFYIRHQQFERALEQYVLAAKFDPTNPKLQVRLGLIFRILGRPKDAIAVLNKALKYDENNAEALKNLVEIYEEQGDHDMAAYYRAKINPEL